MVQPVSTMYYVRALRRKRCGYPSVERCVDVYERRGATRSLPSVPGPVPTGVQRPWVGFGSGSGSGQVGSGRVLQRKLQRRGAAYGCAPFSTCCGALITGMKGRNLLDRGACRRIGACVIIGDVPASAPIGAPITEHCNFPKRIVEVFGNLGGFMKILDHVCEEKYHWK